jgi:hypothetical protein
MQHRRRFKQIDSLEERLAQEAERLRAEAKKLPPGFQRETLLRKARQAEIARERVAEIARVAAARLN